MSIPRTLLCLVVALLLSCSGDDAVQCESGDKRDCECAYGSDSTQRCSSSGLWRDCSCSSKSDDDDDDEADCDEGDEKDCECPDGEESIRVCGEDGWGRCEDCEEAVEYGECEENMVADCTCYDGSEGRRFCGEDGLWGACKDCESNESKTECGDDGLECDRLTEICVLETAAFFEYKCKRLPSGCTGDRSCECVASSVCDDVFDECKDWSAPNTVACNCSDCDK
jgi:hypothetical protein